jgi:UDP-N-acetylmuramyl pentapeptide phosphotransferase/UDP-N-acetylglucosamine-1-phosphate transferase
MAPESFLQRSRAWYARLLRLYPTQFRERFGEGMEQTFADSCRRRRTAGVGLFGFVIWVFAETFTAIVREHVTRLGRNVMRDDIRLLKTVKYAATAGGFLLVAGILTLMVLARGKTGDDGDIAGVVAPALLLACVSGVVAVVAAMRQTRAQRGVGRP